MLKKTRLIFFSEERFLYYTVYFNQSFVLVNLLQLESPCRQLFLQKFMYTIEIYKPCFFCYLNSKLQFLIHVSLHAVLSINIYFEFWTGIHCDQEFRACDGDPCGSRGVCQERGSSHMCFCLDGTRRRTCVNGKKS